MTKNLTIIISTMNDNINYCEKAIQIQHPNILYLIIHQNHTNTPIPDFLKRPDIEVITSQTKGLSKSRNIGIKECKTKYALIADDDVIYIENGLLKILNIINDNNLDFATFKIKTPDGKDYKNYHNEETYIEVPFFHWFSSIEILVNTITLKNNNISFDERFGLGTFLRKNEEDILIKDLLYKKTTGKFFPTYIVIHPYESSGKKKLSEILEYFILGATIQRNNIKNTKLLPFPKKMSIFRKMKNVLFYMLGKLYIKATNYFH